MGALLRLQPRWKRTWRNERRGVPLARVMRDGWLLSSGLQTVYGGDLVPRK
jgi:endonuclease YncB( thermonuclease family)